jgi:hypothetical protein
MFKCMNCGNTEKFYVSAKEYHTWVVDGQGHFISDIDTGDCEKSDDYCCTECDSFDVKEVKND